MIDIEVILADLKEGKGSRTKKSLDTLNDILRVYHGGNNRDFSITQIGRVASARGGPGYASIRATKNDHYRRLIEAWAAYAGTTIKKPLAATSRNQKVPTDHKLLERIPDVALRAIFGQILAERNKLKTEVNILKQHANIIIDKRPNRQFDPRANVEVLPPTSGVLNEQEVKSLEYAISEECMEHRGWQYSQAGQVKDIELNEEIFPRGFVTAIRKLVRKS